MARQLYVFDHPRRFVAGTVGQPGERTFYLQASDGLRTVTVGLEKEQVKILAERLDDIVDEVTRRGDIPPVEAPPADLEPLEMPVAEEFRVSALGLAWDDNDHVIVVEAVSGEAGGIDEDSIFSDEDEAPDAMRVRIDAATAKSFTARAIALVDAGRAACPLCARPLEPSGHICPRQNGYHRAALS